MSKGLERAGIYEVEIERTHDQVQVDIHTARPGIMIGRHGAKADRIRGDLEKLTGKQVQLNILEVKDPETDASSSRRASPSSSSSRSRSVARCARRSRPRSAPASRASGSSAPAVSAAPRCPVRSSTARVGCRCTRFAPTSTTASSRPDDLRPHRRQGVDLQGRRVGSLAEHKAAAGRRAYLRPLAPEATAHDRWHRASQHPPTTGRRTERVPDATPRRRRAPVATEPPRPTPRPTPPTDAGAPATQEG